MQGKRCCAGAPAYSRRAARARACCPRLHPAGGDHPCSCPAPAALQATSPAPNHPNTTRGTAQHSTAHCTPHATPHHTRSRPPGRAAPPAAPRGAAPPTGCWPAIPAHPPHAAALQGEAGGHREVGRRAGRQEAGYPVLPHARSGSLGRWCGLAAAGKQRRRRRTAGAMRRPRHGPLPEQLAASSQLHAASSQLPPSLTRHPGHHPLQKAQRHGAQDAPHHVPLLRHAH